MQFNDLFSVVEDITINDIENWEFNDWKEKGNLLTFNNYDEIEKFYNKEYNKFNPPYYHCFPMFNTITNTTNYKYVIIKNDDDSIFIAYKVIQIIKNKVIKIIDKPISINGDINIEQRIIDILKVKNFFKFTFKEKYLNLYGGGEISLCDCDSFFERKHMEEKYTPKYLRKNFVNRFYTEGFKITLNECGNHEDMLKLRQVWENSKVSGGVQVTTKLNKYMKIYDELNNDTNFVQLNIYHNDELLLNYVYMIYGDCLINIYRTSLSRTTKEAKDDSWLKNTLSKADTFATYYTFKELPNIAYIYYSGTNPTNKTLMEYKEIHSSGRITYYVLNSDRG